MKPKTQIVLVIVAATGVAAYIYFAWRQQQTLTDAAQSLSDTGNSLSGSISGAVADVESALDLKKKQAISDAMNQGIGDGS